MLDGISFRYWVMKVLRLSFFFFEDSSVFEVFVFELRRRFSVLGGSAGAGSRFFRRKVDALYLRFRC